jgi:hypothetical protein
LIAESVALAPAPFLDSSLDVLLLIPILATAAMSLLTASAHQAQTVPADPDLPPHFQTADLAADCFGILVQVIGLFVARNMLLHN